jgi:hypothetical protein
MFLQMSRQKLSTTSNRQSATFSFIIQPQTHPPWLTHFWQCEQVQSLGIDMDVNVGHVDAITSTHDDFFVYFWSQIATLVILILFSVT